MTFTYLCQFIKRKNPDFNIEPFKIVRQLVVYSAKNKRELNICAIAAQKIARILHIGSAAEVQYAHLLLKYIKSENLNKIGVQQWVFVVKSAHINWPKETEQQNVFIPLSIQTLYRQYNINRDERWRARYKKNTKKAGNHNIIAALLHAKEINTQSDAIAQCSLPEFYKSIAELRDASTFSKKTAANLILKHSDEHFNNNEDIKKLLRNLNMQLDSLIQEHC